MTTVLIEIAQEVIEELFTRDHLGNRLRVDWGERGADGFHSPTITVDYVDNLVAARNAEITRLRAALEGHHRFNPVWDGDAMCKECDAAPAPSEEEEGETP